MTEEQIEAFYPLTLAARRFFHKIAHGVTVVHAGSEISVGMRAVLESVIEGGPQTVPQMARVRPVTRQHIQTLVNQLLEGGYVQYVDNPAHKSSRLVSATKWGRAAFEDMRETEYAAFRQAAIEPTPQELETATKVLRSLIATFDGSQWEGTLEQFTAKKETTDD